MNGGGSRARFVLVEPQTSANVGAAARAIKNLGFARLDLVAPRCDPKDDEACRLAVDAKDLLGHRAAGFTWRARGFLPPARTINQNLA